MRYQAKAVAVQLTDKNARDVALFADLKNVIGYDRDSYMVVETSVGPEIARVGDYVLRTEDGTALIVMRREEFETLFKPRE